LVVRAVLGVVCLLVPAWVVVTRWSTLVAGHPAYPVLLAVLVVIGVVLLVRLGRPRRTGRWPVVGRAAGALVLVAVLGFTVYLSPFAADPVAVDATGSTPTVEVVDGVTTWELRPRGGSAEFGVVFFPGALVDPRAYLALLRPLAEDGRLVVVVKPPFGVALLSTATAALDAHPEVTRWAVGGHSLGGVAAATAAGSDQRVGGVFFWASYPNRDLSRAPLVAASVVGDRDTVINQFRFDEARTQLPPDTAYTVVPGAVHAFFGDYGPQPGDGTPATSRADAQREIVAATERFLAELTG
jgi:dienelactone hydrolase